MSTKQTNLEHQLYFSSDDEDPELLESNKELEKLNTMWKNLKETKKGFNQSNVSNILNKNYYKPHNKSLTFEESLGNKTSSDSLNKEKETNFQQGDSIKEKNSQLMKKLAEANEEIEKCHEKIAKERNNNIQKDSKIEEITSKIENISFHQREFLDKSRTNHDIFEQELDKRNSQIEKLIQTNYKLEENVKYLEIKVTDLEEHNQLLQQNLTLKTNENSRIKNKLSETEKTIDEIFLNKKAESSALLELEYLRGDVERLLGLLRSTQEFKEFTLNKEGSDVRYLKEISKRINICERNSSITRNSRICCNEKHSNNEKFFWIPKETFEFAQKFKESLKGQVLSNDMIESLLFELNKIWISKEARMKNFYEKEINKTKRYYSSMVSCGDLQSKKTISRLQSQLKVLKENKENVLEAKKLMFPYEDNKKSQISDDVDPLEKEIEIRRLRQRIEELESERNENIYDKSVYMEGSYWMIKKVMKELNLINTFLNQLETVFRKKLDEIVNALSIKEKDDEKNEIFYFYEWIIENLYEVFNTYKDKLLNMMEGIKQKLNQNVSYMKSKNECEESLNPNNFYYQE